MTNTVTCPECHRPATVIDRFTLVGAAEPVEYLRIQCDGPLSFLASAAEIERARSVGVPVAA
ncbi:MAG: hypothetical protein ACRDRK_10110 [Pseudonocardia sp.]